MQGPPCVCLTLLICNHFAGICRTNVALNYASHAIMLCSLLCAKPSPDQLCGTSQTTCVRIMLASWSMFLSLY